MPLEAVSCLGAGPRVDWQQIDDVYVINLLSISKSSACSLRGAICTDVDAYLWAAAQITIVYHRCTQLNSLWKTKRKDEIKWTLASVRRWYHFIGLLPTYMLAVCYPCMRTYTLLLQSKLTSSLNVIISLKPLIREQIKYIKSPEFWPSSRKYK